MKNVMPFPLQTNIAKQNEEKPKQQPFSYIKMTVAVVVGNIIAVAGLFVMFLIFLNTVTPFVD